MIEIKGVHFIAGEESQKSQEQFSGVNPRTREVHEVSYSNATEEEIDTAVRAAVSAFEEMRHYPAERMAGFLDRVAGEIEAMDEQLIMVADEETALGRPRLTGELARTNGQLRKFGAMLREGSYVEAIIDKAQPNRKPAARPDIRRMLIPTGPVAVFSASNFPFAFAVCGGDTASAWAAGCPVVVKGHPSHPRTSELFGRAINKAITALDFPPGTFSLIHGESIDTGQILVNHPGITAVAFTGSLRGGRAIYNAAAARPTPIPVFAEMGSINPQIMLPGPIAANGESLADALVNSLTLGSGQFCTNPGLVLVVDSEETREFINIVSRKMAEKEPGVLLNEQIERGLAEVVSNTGKKDGVTQLVGGDVIAEGSYCFANTVMQTSAATFRADPELQEEHFGPVTLFVVAESLDDLRQTIRVLDGNLSASVHALEEEYHLAGELFDLLREKAGRLILNGFPTGVEVIYAMTHGGPYPATTAPSTTSVGMTAVKRFMRPVTYQNMPDELLPLALKEENPLGIWRIVDEERTK